MQTRQIDGVAELTSSAQLLTKNWLLAVPNLIASVVFFGVLILIGGGGLLAAGGLAALGSHAGGAGLPGLVGALIGAFAIACIVGGLVSLITYAATVAAADGAWKGQALDIGGAFGRALGQFLNLLIAGIIVGVIAVIVAITFVGPILVGYFFMYAIPAIILGGHSGTSALGESWRLTTKNAGPSIIAFLGIIVAYVVGTIVNMILGHVPILGWIISIAITALLSAFACVVIARFYELLRGQSPATTMPRATA